MNTARGVLKGLSGKSTWVTHLLVSSPWEIFSSLAARVPKGASSAQVTFHKLLFTDSFHSVYISHL
jgi:hypothetical protein